MNDGSFSVSSFTYEYSSKYGGEEMDAKRHKIPAITFSDDGLKAHLKVEGFRELHVFELKTDGLKSTSGKSLDHPNAWYTLNRIPQ